MPVFFTNLSLIEFQVRYLALLLLFSVIDGFEWFWMGSLHMNIPIILEFLKAPFLVLHFSYYTLMTFLMTLSVILLSMLMILLSIPNVIRYLICGNSLNWFLNLNLIYKTLEWGRKWLVDFNAGKTQLVFFDRPNNTGAIDVKTDVSVLKEKSSLSGLLHHLYSKTSSKKIGALICSMKFLFPEVAVYLNKSTIHPCVEYCCHVWAGAPSCYLEWLGKLQKRIRRTVGPSLSASLEPLAHCRDVASLSLFYRYHFGRCSSELVDLVPLPFSRGRSTRYSDRLHDFCVTIPRCYTDVNSFFPRTARFWNSLPIECFPLTYNLNDFKSRINRHLLTVGSL